MNEPNNAINGHSASPDSQDDEPLEEEISVLDILLVLARNRILIGVTIAIFGVLGLFYAMSARPTYTASADLIREVEPDASMRNLSGLSLLRGFGINLGGGATGLTPEAYPSLMRSREVRLAVVQDTFYFGDAGRRMTYVAYLQRPPGFLSVVKDYTIGLPWKIRAALKSAPPSRTAGGTTGAAAFPTEQEEVAMKLVDELVETSTDLETGLMSIAATTHDPVFSAQLTSSFVQHLAVRVREIKTQKARENLKFIQERFQAGLEDLEQAEDALAQFDDRNANIQSARLRTERDQLQRQVSFKEELYTELQAQLTQAEIELQRSTPILTVIEEPVPPVEPSGPKRMLILIVSLFLGSLLGIGLAFARVFFQRQESDVDGRSKLDEIRRAVTPSPAVRARMHHWIRRRKTRDADAATDIEQG